MSISMSFHNISQYIPNITCIPSSCYLLMLLFMVASNTVAGLKGNETVICHAKYPSTCHIWSVSIGVLQILIHMVDKKSDSVSLISHL